jgi:rhodanese-related sulfurtransferase
MSSVKTITTEQLDERLRKGGAFQFWNVLSDRYFTGELIPGSLRVPVDFVGREAAKLRLPKDGEIIVYCKDTECPASARAAEKLQTLGYTNVRAYEGGLKAWNEAGLPVVLIKNSTAA